MSMCKAETGRLHPQLRAQTSTAIEGGARVGRRNAGWRIAVPVEQSGRKRKCVIRAGRRGECNVGGA